MHINKILRTYFVALMVMTAMGVVTTNEMASSYLASVLNANVTEKEPLKASNSPQTFHDTFGAGAEVHLENTLEEAYVQTDQKEVKLMNIRLKNFDVGAILNKMQFRMASGNGDEVLKAYVVEGEEVLSEATNNKGVFNFRNLGIKFVDGFEKYYQIRVELSDKVTPGNRLRMDMELPFEIKGPYLTIVGGAQ